jgi:hypothetical protein
MAFPEHKWAASILKEYNSFPDFVISLEDAKKRKEIKRYINFRDQVEWISSCKEKKNLMDFVGRYESLQEDCACIYGAIGIPPPPSMLSERKSTHGKDYRKIYTPKVVDLVQRIYGADIEAFGYEFE